MKNLFILIFIIISCISITNATTSNSFNNSDSTKYYLTKAKESKEARRVWEAEKYFKKALEFDNENEEVRIEFASYYEDQRKYALATQQYRFIIQKNPTHRLALPKYISLSFLQRRWTEVIQHGELAIANKIPVENINFMLGKSYYEEEDYGKARKYLTTQFSLTPKHKETVIALGRVYIEMSMYNDAIDMYKIAIVANPDDFELMYEIGLLYSVQDNNREAVKYFELAAQKGIKQDIAFLQNLGMAYLAFDIKKGVEVLNKVLEKKPGDVEILTQIAQAYYKAEQYGIAHDMFFQIFENDTKNTRALYMAGVALIKKGDKKRGSQLCDRAIAMDPQLAKLRSQKSVL
ncbi:MAG: tetratricopeptide repeat protein [Chitinophagaceae bacterium]|nr:tetratricopeptide repeat protein [Chitinophagaceae bacterium]MCW5905975.1 tetratricopeptide repeat protein [Chitinophagaceae bacterium]